jgi:RNA polymerase sigma-70 factor, ECF subfamily
MGKSQTLVAGLAPLVAELYLASQGEAYGLDRDRFGSILQEIAAKYLPESATDQDVRDLCRSLRIEELVLARACAAGHEHAWEVFMTRYREKLYHAAGCIAHESSAARDLADGLYADLFGTAVRGNQRVSKLASYTGRGSLEGWLRTVLAQEYVNRYRKQRRLVSLDEETEEGEQFAAREEEPAGLVDPRLVHATDDVLAALPAEDRFVLASYYLDERTLAEIARMLNVHESTISRRLDRLAKSLRKQLLGALGKLGMSRQQAIEALEVDVRDLTLNIRERLKQENPSPAFPEKGAGTKPVA